MVPGYLGHDTHVYNPRRVAYISSVTDFAYNLGIKEQRLVEELAKHEARAKPYWIPSGAWESTARFAIKDALDDIRRRFPDALSEYHMERGAWRPPL